MKCPVVNQEQKLVLQEHLTSVCTEPEAPLSVQSIDKHPESMSTLLC